MMDISLKRQANVSQRQTISNIVLEEEWVGTGVSEVSTAKDHNLLSAETGTAIVWSGPQN
jgi:hypothetical protein